MADYVKRPTIYKRVQYTGDGAAFLAELQAETNGVWNWEIYENENAPGSAVAVRFFSNAQPPGFVEVGASQYLVFQDGPDERPYLDGDGSSVVPA